MQEIGIVQKANFKEDAFLEHFRNFGNVFYVKIIFIFSRLHTFVCFHFLQTSKDIHLWDVKQFSVILIMTIFCFAKLDETKIKCIKTERDK